MHKIDELTGEPRHNHRIETPRDRHETKEEIAAMFERINYRREYISKLNKNEVINTLMLNPAYIPEYIPAYVTSFRTGTPVFKRV